jgi:hypothetical protein
MPPSEMQDDLDRLEKMIRQLQIEWEKFFGGVEKKAPNDLRLKLEQIIRRYAGVEIRNNQDRFRYQGLTSRYNTFNELWQKRMRAIEEGRVAGLHVTKAMLQHVPPSALPPEPEPPARAARPAAAAVAAGAKEYRIQNPAGDGTMVKALYRQFVDERKKTGETAAVSYDSFEKLIGQQTSRILTEKGAQAVDFRIESKDGKVSLKAKPVK